MSLGHASFVRAPRAFLLFVVLALASWHAGCGSGDALPDHNDGVNDPTILPSDIDDPGNEPGNGNEPPVQNQAPNANAGPDQEVASGAEVLLDGSQSSDPDGDELIFAWASADGFEFDLSGGDTAQAGFIAPVIEIDSVFEFTLRVSDGELESQDVVRILVKAEIVAAGVGPQADAGPDQSAESGTVVSLSGAGSTSDDGGELDFVWFQVDGPEVALSNTSGRETAFTAPSVASEVMLIFELTVTENGLSDIDEVRVTVVAPPEEPVPTEPPPSPPPPPPPPSPPDTTDNCPDDPDKTNAGVCGCGVPDTDSDGDGSPNCVDGCPSNAPKTSAGVCGCAVPDTDSDSDGSPNCVDGCPTNPLKIAPEVCGCTVLDTDTDGDGTPNCNDGCPTNPAKIAPGTCGCTMPDTDSDADGTPNCIDGCPTNPAKITPGVCGCSASDTDGDDDGTPNCVDGCPTNPTKIAPGVCGCTLPDADSDGDGTLNCVDGCPSDPAKTSAGQCGCGVADIDTDGDTVANCVDGCPLDPTTSDPNDCAAAPGGGAQTDWDLVMLRLLNRARIDPAGEAARLGSSVVDTRAPVPPLAYDRYTGLAATNHNTWMHLNLGNIASGNAPDSFTHFETTNGSSAGTPATGTPGYTGATVGARMTAAGMSWGSVGENILTSYSTNTIAITEAKMISNHRGWWESAGHRNNMLSTSYTSFGHKAESRTFTPPRGGLSAPVDNILFATQNFARPLSNPRYYIFGLLYEDMDASGTWTPRDVGHVSREGLAGVSFTVVVSGTSTVVASDTTMDNGAFSVRLADGMYDLRFTDSSLPGGTLTISGIAVTGANVDTGDWDTGP